MIVRLLCGASLAATLSVVGWTVSEQEQILEDGRTVYLELAPLDPRSLLQGDYMRLNYALGRIEYRETGHRFVVSVDPREVATTGTWIAPDTELNEDQVAFPATRGPSDTTKISPDSYLFEDGKAEAYEAARYAQFSVLPDGRAAMVALTDDTLVPLDHFRAPLSR